MTRIFTQARSIVTRTYQRNISSGMGDPMAHDGEVVWVVITSRAMEFGATTYASVI